MKNTNIKAKAHLVKFSDNVLLKDLILFAKEQRDIEWLESLFTGNQFEVDNLHEFIEFLERQTILLNKELGDEPFSLLLDVNREYELIVYNGNHLLVPYNATPDVWYVKD